MLAGGQRLFNSRTSKNTREKSMVGNFYGTKNRTKEADSSDINGQGKVWLDFRFSCILY